MTSERVQTVDKLNPLSNSEDDGKYLNNYVIIEAVSGDIFEVSPNKICISSPRPKTTSEGANTNYVTHDDVAQFSSCYTCCLNLFLSLAPLLQFLIFCVTLANEV